MSVEPWALVGLHANVRFVVLAEASAGLLPRLMEPFARRDLVPSTFEATHAGAQLRVEIAMQAMPAEMVHLVEGNMRQVVGVTSLVRSAEITGSVRRRAA